MLICGVALLVMGGVTAQEQQDSTNQIQTTDQVLNTEEETDPPSETQINPSPEDQTQNLNQESQIQTTTSTSPTEQKTTSSESATSSTQSKSQTVNTSQSTTVQQSQKPMAAGSPIVGFWIWSSDFINSVDPNYLRSIGVTDVFVLVSRSSPGSVLSSWKVNSLIGMGVRVHAWIICFKQSGTWVDPETPGFRAGLLNDIHNIAYSYNISGIHLDYVRYSGLAYKNQAAWQHPGATSIITNFVSQVNNTIGNKILSAALMPETYNNAYLYGQDYAQLSHYLDWLIPMIYKGNYGHTYDPDQGTGWIGSTTRYIVNQAGGKTVLAGLQTYRSDSDTTRVPAWELQNDINAALINGAGGFVLFRYGLANYSGLTIYPTTKRVSVNLGTQSNGASYKPSITPDGRYVAFYSFAKNLVSGVNNGKSNIYVYDDWTGKIIRISRGIGGAQANGDSFNPVITPDGRYVAFYSFAKNLVSGVTNGYSNIFVFDGWTGKMIRVSKGLSGSQANGNSLNPAITPDCRYVAFSSFASNLVGGDTNGKSDIFVYDGWTGKTIRVSKALNGQANGESSNPAITPECRYVAFDSVASNLVGGDTNGKSDVFVFDGWTGKMIKVSKGLSGQANGNSSHPSITPNCRYVAFDSVASNLVGGDTNGKSDVFVFDGWTGQTRRVSIGPGGRQANNESKNPSISADCRYVAFESLASNLVSGDSNSCWDVFVYDGWTNQASRMSISTGGTQGNGKSANPSISTDGRYVAFDSDANTLTSGDTNSKKDIFVRDRGTS